MLCSQIFNVVKNFLQSTWENLLIYIERGLYRRIFRDFYLYHYSIVIYFRSNRALLTIFSIIIIILVYLRTRNSCFPNKTGYIRLKLTDIGLTENFTPIFNSVTYGFGVFSGVTTIFRIFDIFYEFALFYKKHFAKYVLNLSSPLTIRSWTSVIKVGIFFAIYRYNLISALFICNCSEVVF